jgi:hypothetical protein
MSEVARPWSYSRATGEPHDEPEEPDNAELSFLQGC